MSSILHSLLRRIQRLTTRAGSHAAGDGNETGQKQESPKMKTLILILLDESESMSSQKADIVKGFNTFIKDQKKMTEDEASVTFLKFNTEVIPIFNSVPIKDVPKLKFTPNGGTALYDAIYVGVRAGEVTENLFDRIICLIMTDGEDNSSLITTQAGIASIIKMKEKEGKWTFLYIGDKAKRWARETEMSALNVSQFDFKNRRQNFSQAHLGVKNLRSQLNLQMPNVFNVPKPLADDGIPVIPPLVTPPPPPPPMPGSFLWLMPKRQ